MLTRMQNKIVATRLSSNSQCIWLQGGALLAANALAKHGYLTDRYWSSLERRHLSDILISEFFNSHPDVFITESLHGEILVFENREFLMSFNPNEQAKAERVVMGLEALRLQQVV